MAKKLKEITVDAPARAAICGLVALYDVRAIPGIACRMIVFDGQGESANASRTYRFIGIEGYPYDVGVEVVRDPGQESDRAWHPHRAWPNWHDPAGRMNWIKIPVGHWG